MSSTAVVILNWNGKDFMKKFIPLILSRVDFSGGSVLYVADNGSQDGSVEWLRETWPDGDVRLVCFDCNYGFTGGYNRAFAEIERSGVKFDYFLLLNSDIEVTDGWLGELEHFMDSHPRCGALRRICGQMVFPLLPGPYSFKGRGGQRTVRRSVPGVLGLRCRSYDPFRAMEAVGRAGRVVLRAHGGDRPVLEGSACRLGDMGGAFFHSISCRGRDFAQQLAPQAVP